MKVLSFCVFALSLSATGCQTVTGEDIRRVSRTEVTDSVYDIYYSGSASPFAVVKACAGPTGAGWAPGTKGCVEYLEKDARKFASAECKKLSTSMSVTNRKEHSKINQLREDLTGQETINQEIKIDTQYEGNQKGRDVLKLKEVDCSVATLTGGDGTVHCRIDCG